MGPDAHAHLRAILVEAGVAGISQQHITHALRNKASASEYLPVLERWRKEKYVQKFFIQTEAAHRPKTIWRATEKILTLQL